MSRGRPSVLIVIEYVATYRVPLFERMRALADDRGLELRIAAGTVTGAQASRGDSVLLEWQEHISQHELRLVGRRVTWRRLPGGRSRPDLIVMDQARRNADVYRLLLPRRLRRSRIALWGHGRDYVQRPSRFDRTLLNVLTRRADWFFAYAPEGGRAAVEAGLPVDRVTVLFNTTDTRALVEDLSSVSEQELGDFRNLHGLTDHTGLFLGGLDRDKRLPFLVQAGDRVVARLPGFRLVVAGSGADEGWLAEAALTRPWLVLLGRVAGRPLSLALRSASVMCMPGRIGLVAVDSLSVGLPLITTLFDGHAPEAEYLEDGVDSVWTLNDIESYAEGLTRVLEDDVRRMLLVRGALAKGKRFSIDEMAERYVDGIESALSAPRR